MSEATHSDTTASEPGQPAADHPDAAILALGERLRAYRARCDDEDRRVAALVEQDTPASREEASRIMEASSERTHEYHQILNGLRDTPAQTVDGMAVKAIAVADWMGAADDVPSSDEDGRVAWSLAHDVLRMRDGQAAATMSSDAELIAICDEIADLDRKAEALDDVDEANFARWQELIARAVTMPAETVDGLRARLRSIGKHLLADNIVGSSTGDARSHFAMAAQDLWRFATGSMGTPAVSPDAELIAACAELERIELDYLRIFHGLGAIPEGEEQEAAIEACTNNERRHDLEAFISETRARTVDGVRAKARAIAAEDLDLNRSGYRPLASLVRDLVGGFDPIAAAKGQRSASAAPKAPSFVETPILELGRRTAAAEKRMEDYDFPEGELYKTVSPDYAALMNGAACDEVWALSGIICDIPALTLQDVVVQLHAAFVLSDQLPEGTKKGAPSARIRKVLASALRVLMVRPGAAAPGTIDDAPDHVFRLAWKGEMPPVQLTS